MALRVLMLRRQVADLTASLKELEEAAQGFVVREAELAKAIEEMSSDEERKTVEEAVAALETEVRRNAEATAKARADIEAAEAEIAELDEKARRSRAAGGKTHDRKEDAPMDTRKFFGMNPQARDAFFARQDVKEFLQRTRELGVQRSSATGAELLIPTVVLDLVREELPKYSKLLKHVRVVSVPGKARQNIMGAIPEAVWTEMCASLNELEISFTSVEVDGYKVGGYIAICNAVLEDSDIGLASEIISALSQSIGIALDKAILYGTGVKMPLGIVTRLAQAEQPSSYPVTARPWANLSTTNILTVTSANSTGVKLFQQVLKNAGAAKKGQGAKFWAMNETTYNTMMAEALSVNASGAVVTGMQQAMPVVGGAVELLDFIPDNNIIGGYGQRYLLAERAGTTLAQSEHVRFLQDQTVFKGTARYDGTPAIAESFVLIGIGGTTPATSVTFAEDKANVTV